MLPLCRPQNLASDGCGLFSVPAALLWTGIFPDIPVSSNVQLHQVMMVATVNKCYYCTVVFNREECSCSLE